MAKMFARYYVVIGIIVFVSVLTAFAITSKTTPTITDSVDFNDSAVLNTNNTTNNDVKKHYTIIASDSPSIIEP